MTFSSLVLDLPLQLSGERLDGRCQRPDVRVSTIQQDVEPGASATSCQE